MLYNPKMALGFGGVAVVSLVGAQIISYRDPYGDDVPTVPVAAFNAPVFGASLAMSNGVIYCSASPIDDSEPSCLVVPPARDEETRE
jgi:hypothetical protein